MPYSKLAMKIILPRDGPILLHSCCAPCSGFIIDLLFRQGFQIEVLFYNPNIYPQTEYIRRKQELVRFAQKIGIPTIDLDYDHQAWLLSVTGKEEDTERGERCAICFQLRLTRAAEYAQINGFPVFATSLGFSRWKDLNQVNAAGRTAAAGFPEVTFWDADWRQDGGTQEGQTLTRRENFYRQQYCGCEFSLRDTNQRRVELGRPAIITSEPTRQTF